MNNCQMISLYQLIPSSFYPVRYYLIYLTDILFIFRFFSCKFEFGIMPLPLEDDPISKTPCLSACPLQLMKEECMSPVLAKNVL